MHLTSSPFLNRPEASHRAAAGSDNHILWVLLEADDAVRMLLLDHLCAGDELRRQRLSELLAAALSWRARDTGPLAPSGMRE